MTFRAMNYHKFPINIECTFLEMTIRKTKWPIVGGYNPHKENISYFFKYVSREVSTEVRKFVVIR